MSPRWQAVFVLAPEHGPLHFPHHGAFVRVLDTIRLPRLLAKHGRVLDQVANLAGMVAGGQSRILLQTPATPVFRPFFEYFRLLHPTVKVGWNLAHKYLPALLQGVEKLAVPAIKLVEGPSRNADAIAQSTIDHLHGELRFGVKLDVVWDVRFFRRAGSFANSSGRYTALSSNT